MADFNIGEIVPPEVVVQILEADHKEGEGEAEIRDENERTIEEIAAEAYAECIRV